MNVSQLAADSTAPLVSASRAERPIDVIAVGESMAVVTPVADESLEHAQLCRLSIGGAESNVLIQLARLGLRTRFISRVGDDPLGRRTVQAIAAAGVDVSAVEVDPRHPTGVYFKDRGDASTGVHYYRRGSAASTLDATCLTSAGIREARALLLTGITPALSPVLADLVERALVVAREHAVIAVFDVNYRPGLWPVDEAGEHLLGIARQADVVFVGLDEARTLWQTTTPADVRKRFPDWPGRLVVKDGAVGATEFRPDGVTFVPAEPVTVVEEVGAGDAFAAGYVASLLAGAPSEECLRRGHGQAALALQSIEDLPPGATP